MRRGPTCRTSDSTSADPESRTDNAFIEAFNGSVRREILSQHYFSTLAEARSLLDRWRLDYNRHRSHGSLVHLSPREYRDRWTSQQGVAIEA